MPPLRKGYSILMIYTKFEKGYDDAPYMLQTMEDKPTYKTTYFKLKERAPQHREMLL